MKLVNVTDETYDLLKGMSEQSDVPIPELIDGFIMNALMDSLISRLRKDVE